MIAERLNVLDRLKLDARYAHDTYLIHLGRCGSCADGGWCLLASLLLSNADAAGDRIVDAERQALIRQLGGA